MFSPASDIDICRMALREVGDSTSLDAFNDDTEAARRCAEFYPQVKGLLLSAAPWPWAKRHVALTRNNGWDAELAAQRSYLYGYNQPPDLVKVRELWSGTTRPRDEYEAIPYDFALLNGVPLIVTNLVDAELIYTADVNVAMFPYMAREALKWALAEKLGPGLRVSAPLAQRAAVERVRWTRAAVRDSLNNVRPEPEPRSVLVARRRF